MKNFTRLSEIAYKHFEDAYDHRYLSRIKTDIPYITFKKWLWESDIGRLYGSMLCRSIAKMNSVKVGE